jgi:hypothetical protein
MCSGRPRPRYRAELRDPYCKERDSDQEETGQGYFL